MWNDHVLKVICNFIIISVNLRYRSLFSKHVNRLNEIKSFV